MTDKEFNEARQYLLEFYKYVAESGAETPVIVKGENVEHFWSTRPVPTLGSTGDSVYIPHTILKKPTPSLRFNKKGFVVEDLELRVYPYSWLLIDEFEEELRVRNTTIYDTIGVRVTTTLSTGDHSQVLDTETTVEQLPR